MSLTWTHAQCESCWIFKNTKRRDDGTVEVRRPILAMGSELTICCFCGGWTLVGIFVRHDPNYVLCKGECGH